MEKEESYLPESEFLNYLFAEEVTIDDTPVGQANLRKLLMMADDAIVSNRDWAALFISQLPMDTPEIRAALLRLADDEDEDVRDEAISGLATRDREAAFVRLHPLLKEYVGVVTLEAAEKLADPRLLPELRAMRDWDGSEFMQDRLEQVIAACEGAGG